MCNAGLIRSKPYRNGELNVDNLKSYEGRGVSAGRIREIAAAAALLICLPAFAQTQTQPQAPYFKPGNLVVSVAGCGVYGGTPPNTTPSQATCATPPVGGTGGTTGTGPNSYGDDQGAPWNLWQYSVNGATSVTFVNSLQLPQNTSGANFPVSDDYGSQSEGTLQLSGNGQYLTMIGYGLNAATFNVNYLNYCPGSTMLSNACVPENGNPAMAQTGTLLGQSYSGNTPVPRVAVLIDANGNVNSSTVLYGIFNQNDARSAYSPDGFNIYVSGQVCKNWDASDSLCDNPNTLYDDTQGVYFTTLGANNYFGANNPIAITGPDNGPEPCSSLTTCTESQSTRMVQIYNNTLYVSMDDKGGNNRSFIGTLGDPPSTSLFTCTGVGGGCGTGYGPYGPAEISGLVNTGGTGKYTINSAGSGNTSNGNNLNAGLAVNLSPQNYWFASPTVLYVADTGSPKNDSNGPDAVCTSNGGSSKATVGDGGLQKWILNPTVTAGVVNTGSTSAKETVSASSGAFTQGEVGLAITDSAGYIPAGTTITAVSGAGANATTSAAATGTDPSDIITVHGWSLVYTLYNGLSLVLNADCDPSSPTTPGSLATTGLYGVTGVVNNGVATLYVTTYPNNDLVQTYLYGITDTLATTKMTSPGTAFTLLDTAPAGSILRGVSFVPTVQSGDIEVTTVPSGLTVTTANTGCAPSTFSTPLTQAWTPGSSCQLSVTTPQTSQYTPGTQYVFSQWQDGTTSTTDTVTAPSSNANNTYTYTAIFTTQYQLTTSAGTGGAVSPGGYYNSGSNAIITATPSAGYYFVNFTGTVTSSTNPLSLTMNAPASITANFAAVQSQTITFTTPAPSSAAYNSNFTVAASGGGSGNPVTFTSAGACTNSGATYTMTSGTGTCSVIANQAGNTQYSAAPQVTEYVSATMAGGSGNISVTATTVAAGIYPSQGDTLSATVTVVGAGGAPSGTGETISFYAGATLLGTGTLSTVDANDSSTTIQITGSQLASGPNSITAVYVGDANYSSTTSQAIPVTLLSPVATFGSNNVGTAATSQTLNYTFTSATTLTAVNILTAGASGLDYADGGSSTCTATAYTAGQSCVVTVAFTPAAPGARAGAVTLFAQGSNLPLMTWYLSGAGQSGAVTIDPGTLTTTTLTGTQTPAGYGTAVDGAGNVYVVDHANNAVLKLAAGTFSQSTVVSGLSAPTGVALDGAGDLYISDYTHTFSPTVLIDVKLSYSRFQDHFPDGDLSSTVTPQSIGLNMPHVPTSNLDLLPEITFSELYPQVVGNSVSNDVYNNTILDPDVTMVRGKHTFHFGGEAAYYQWGTPRSVGRPNGYFEFGTQYTQANPYQRNTIPGVDDGSVIADLLLGYPDNGGVDYNASQWTTFPTLAVYAQDNWHLTPKLTIDIGLRYDIQFGLQGLGLNRGMCLTCVNPITNDPTYQANLAADLPIYHSLGLYPDLTTITGGVLFAGKNGQPNDAYNTDYTNIGPRFGFAYQLTPKTVLRGGYGIMYSVGLEGGSTVGSSESTPYVASLNNNLTPDNYFASGNPFPNGYLTPLGAAGGLLTGVGNGASFDFPDRRIPRSQQFSFGVQRELPWNAVLDARYVGNYSDRLRTTAWNGSQGTIWLNGTWTKAQLQQAIANPNIYEQNVPNPFYGVPGVPSSSYLGSSPQIPYLYLSLPWPEFPGPLGSYDDPLGKSRYNGLEVELNKRVSRGISFRADYTYSKTMVAGGYLNGWPYQDPKLLYEIAPSDRTHVFAFSGVWDLPMIHSDSSGLKVLGAVVNHWRLDGVLLAETGFPESLPGGIYLSTHPYTPDGGPTTEQWIYNCNGNPTACYETSLPPFVLSQQPGQTSSLREPQNTNLDLNLIRLFPITERWKLELRGEALNVLNSVLFQPPDTNPNDGPPVKTSNGSWEGFGTVPPFQYNFPRIIKIALKLYF